MNMRLSSKNAKNSARRGVATKQKIRRPVRIPIPDIPVRCCSQGPDEVPLSQRPRLSRDIREVSDALGDLGTFLPHIIGAITVVGMNLTRVLTAFGLFYVFTGAFYAMPLPSSR